MTLLRSRRAVGGYNEQGQRTGEEEEEGDVLSEHKKPKKMKIGVHENLAGQKIRLLLHPYLPYYYKLPVELPDSHNYRDLPLLL
jgi:hypothetical protein